MPGSILAHWKLCIAAGLQMEYGMRPGCICARVDTRELGAMYSGGLADGIWECQNLVLYSKPGSLRIFWPRGRKKKGVSKRAISYSISFPFFFHIPSASPSLQGPPVFFQTPLWCLPGLATVVGSKAAAWKAVKLTEIAKAYCLAPASNL